MVKLFADYIVMTFHQADRSSQFGFLLVQLQDRIVWASSRFCLCCLELNPVAAASCLHPKIVLEVTVLDTDCLASSPSAVLILEL